MQVRVELQVNTDSGGYEIEVTPAGASIPLPLLKRTLLAALLDLEVRASPDVAEPAKVLVKFAVERHAGGRVVIQEASIDAGDDSTQASFPRDVEGPVYAALRHLRKTAEGDEPPS